MKIKKLHWQISIFLIATVSIVTILSLVSYNKALKIDDQILKPCLSSERKYDRKIGFKFFDPWVSILPHWEISYHEKPTDVHYMNPSITVYILGEVDGNSKEVLIKLVEKGYRSQY